MAEPAITSQTVMAVGAVGTVVAAKNSVIAKSLLSANFEQIVNGHFTLQMGDVISIVGVALLLWNSFKHKLPSKEVDQD